MLFIASIIYILTFTREAPDHGGPAPPPSLPLYYLQILLWFPSGFPCFLPGSFHYSALQPFPRYPFQLPFFSYRIKNLKGNYAIVPNSNSLLSFQLDNVNLSLLDLTEFFEIFQIWEIRFQRFRDWNIRVREEKLLISNQFPSATAWQFKFLNVHIPNIYLNFIEILSVPNHVSLFISLLLYILDLRFNISLLQSELTLANL